MEKKICSDESDHSNDCDDSNNSNVCDNSNDCDDKKCTLIIPPKYHNSNIKESEKYNPYDIISPKIYNEILENDGYNNVCFYDKKGENRIKENVDCTSDDNNCNLKNDDFSNYDKVNYDSNKDLKPLNISDVINICDICNDKKRKCNNLPCDCILCKKKHNVCYCNMCKKKEKNMREDLSVVKYNEYPISVSDPLNLLYFLISRKIWKAVKYFFFFYYLFKVIIDIYIKRKYMHI
ncbi:hypothetical protein PFFCH_00021 [Plasmodium falciparum FCH/4]|uniref:Uncharacterized protein n=1 Tax=Plasmodium falciparum FCH/4 TaxID=1036724 RepID=A0A024VXB4_PLAFA|nr:hypothetical protein PFFCH_00021 [Plasmodium falciparum FCH/4]